MVKFPPEMRRSWGVNMELMVRYSVFVARKLETLGGGALVGGSQGTLNNREDCTQFGHQ